MKRDDVVCENLVLEIHRVAVRRVDPKSCGLIRLARRSDLAFGVVTADGAVGGGILGTMRQSLLGKTVAWNAGAEVVTWTGECILHENDIIGVVYGLPEVKT